MIISFPIIIYDNLFIYLFASIFYLKLRGLSQSMLWLRPVQAPSQVATEEPITVVTDF